MQRVHFQVRVGVFKVAEHSFSARFCWCKLAACTRQTFPSKTFTNSLNMQNRNNTKKCLGNKQWHVLVVGKSTDHDKPHFDLFFTTMSTSKKTFFFRTRAKKVIAWHIDASSVVWTLKTSAVPVSQRYVIKQMVNAIACTFELWCTWEVCYALKKLESHSAVASCDSYASFVLSNLPRAP